MPEHENIFFLTKPLQDPILSPASEMRKACRATRRQSVAQELFARWPNLRESSHRLTSLLTMYWPDPRNYEESLLVNCLTSGFIEADRVINAERDDLSEQRAFICRISEELVRCLELTVMIKRKSGVWSIYDVNTDDSLDEIINSPTNDEITWVNKRHKAFMSPQSKLLCASKVFTLDELMMAGLMEGSSPIMQQ